MPKSIDFEGVKHEFPDDFSDADISKALSSATPKTGKHWSDGIENPLAKGVVDVAEGIKAGAASTVYHGGDLIRRATGMERIIDKPEVRAQMKAPDSIAGKAGQFIEQAGEFLIPGMAASKALKAAPLLGRMAGEAAIASGVAGVQSGGNTNAMRDAALLAGAGAGVVSALGGVAPKAAAFLRSSAEKQYGQVLNPTKISTKFLSQNQVAPGLLDRGVVSATMGGLKSKIGAKVEQLGAAIGDEWDKLPPGTLVDLEPVVNRVQAQAEEMHTIATSAGKLIAKGPEAQRAINNINNLQETLMDVAEINPSTGTLQIPVEKLRSLRQYWDGVAAKAGRYGGKDLADSSAAEAHGMAADSIREELAKSFPDIAKINKEFNFWKNANEVVSATISRREGQAKPLGKKLVGAAGAAAGMASNGTFGLILGKVAGEQFEALITSPAWGTVSAVAKDQLAKHLASGNKVGSEFTIRKMLKAAGLEAVAASSTRESPTGQLSPAMAR